MKAISLWQPWASLIAMGLKQYETRSWSTNYRGPLLICSAQRKQDEQFYQWTRILQVLEDELGILKSKPNDGFPMWDDLPFGCAIAFVELTDCIKMTDCFIQEQTQCEIECGEWSVGRFAWKLEEIRIIAQPFYIRGRQKLFDVEVDLTVEDLEEVA